MCIRLLYMMIITQLIIRCIVWWNSMSNSNQLWNFHYYSLDLYLIIMMDMSWWKNTINWWNRNSIWNG